jgi:hypothetical protein
LLTAAAATGVGTSGHFEAIFEFFDLEGIGVEAHELNQLGVQFRRKGGDILHDRSPQ